jgi:glutamine amidotransferase
MSAMGGGAPAVAPAGRRVTVIDAGVGNLGNLERALTHLGAVVEVTCEPRRIAAARCLVLPGVGAFAPPRETLRGAMEEAIGAALAADAWLLGICVGFQLLFDAGEEFGVTDGLGLLPGRVRRLPAGVQVPHIGWNRLHDLADHPDHPLLAGLAAPAPGAVGQSGAPEAPGGSIARRGPYVYFVHSYAAEGVPPEMCLALATHGRAFAAVAGRGRVFGTQFHPERSGAAGLRLLANFLEIADGSAAGD